MVDQELPTLPEHMSSSNVYRGDRVAQSFVFVQCFADHCLSIFLKVEISLLQVYIYISPIPFSITLQFEVALTGSVCRPLPII